MQSNDNTDLLKIFANDQRMILYRPEWRTFTGSVTATILLQQILYRWDKNGRKPFYKFKEPCGHDLYRPGDSWTEELGFSKKEFDSALKRIGTKTTQKTPGPTTSLVEYWTDINRVTFYNINPEILHGELDKLYAASNETGFTKSPKGDLHVNTERGFTKNANEDLPHYKQRLLTENDNVQPVKSDTPDPEPIKPNPPEPSSSLISSKDKDIVATVAALTILLPERFQNKPSIEAVIKKALTAHPESYVKSAIQYSNVNSTGGTLQKFKSYLGKTIDLGWADGWEPNNAQGDTGPKLDFTKIPDASLKFMSDGGNVHATAELQRRKGVGE